MYFAERKHAEGKDWHNVCFNRWYKKKREEESRGLFGFPPAAESAGDAKEATKRCPDCDCEVAAAVRFCTSCGYKFE